MAKRMTSKERIQQKAEEAAAGKEAKAEKKVKKKKAATPRKKAATVPTRKKVVWKVFDSGYKEVACFPYPEKDKAYTTADELIAKKKKHYFVNDVTVPMEDE